ncbi:5-formyltetrahydrofolate cyclo-ligase [Photobacterium sp. GJ3]|uniref:5-formyltetrahydrofolate cyclo-ligase n=1 Tax=Photobacterium sp. GJ3 TaxID=2829502 RepID=UPI001B8BD778|nr:5-formyltetrahydrofolate cyclo-ligase [Photobacterium sp. GJ3]QUJ67008.1 5-formyltetrahydrofolate cyclo-ligase [Photobacterium sp. GJ3]
MDALHHGGPATQSTRQQLRQQIRLQRQALTPHQQEQASKAVLARFTQLKTIRDARHIAIYLSNDGELDTGPLIDWIWRQGKNVYLPVLHPFSKGHLLFLHYRPDSPMRCNRYGIAEPALDVRLVKPVHELDIVCTPLVAFDDQGQRLGMGGGYYDRTLSQWHQSGLGPQPLGLAHDCQQVRHLPSEAWDVPLPAILTPSAYHHW